MSEPLIQSDTEAEGRKREELIDGLLLSGVESAMSKLSRTKQKALRRKQNRTQRKHFFIR